MPSRSPFQRLCSYCRDGQGGYVAFPLWPDTPADLVPWDVSAVFLERKYLDWRDLERTLKGREAPPPTPRTLYDTGGFQAWCDYVKESEEAMAKASDETHQAPWPGSGLPAVTLSDDDFHYVEAFDHIVWRREENLVLYDYGASFMYPKRHADAEARKRIQERATGKPAENAGTSIFYR